MRRSLPHVTVAGNGPGRPRSVAWPQAGGALLGGAGPGDGRSPVRSADGDATRWSSAGDRRHDQSASQVRSAQGGAGAGAGCRLGALTSMPRAWVAPLAEPGVRWFLGGPVRPGRKQWPLPATPGVGRGWSPARRPPGPASPPPSRQHPSRSQLAIPDPSERLHVGQILRSSRTLLHRYQIVERSDPHRHGPQSDRLGPAPQLVEGNRILGEEVNPAERVVLVDEGEDQQVTGADPLGPRLRIPRSPAPGREATDQPKVREGVDGASGIVRSQIEAISRSAVKRGWPCRTVATPPTTTNRTPAPVRAARTGSKSLIGAGEPRAGRPRQWFPARVVTSP